MILKNNNYKNLIEDIKKTNTKIIIYGAGMIGQVIVPYLIKEYKLYEYVDCFVDIDSHKIGKTIIVDDFKYEIKSTDYLNIISADHVILITNSNFSPVVNFLDGIKNLNDINGYIIPMIQLQEIENSESITIKKITENMMIPKVIHYCWFGRNEKNEFLKECISSWKEQCPDYEVIEWNENNYDVNRHIYTKEAYEKGKYGFVSDFARLDILYENGGIYLDTDVKLIKNLDNLLYQSGFVGTEKWGNINSGGGCGFSIGHPMLKRLLEFREKINFILEDGTLNPDTCGLYESSIFTGYGFKPNNQLQIIEGVTIYPSYVNHPYDYMSCELQKKDATVSVHLFSGGWMSPDEQKNRINTQKNYYEMKKRMTLR